MAKRYYFHQLRQHDLDHDDCAVRQLEMTSDIAISSPSYSIQFWRDVELYGVDEAILYVKNGNHGDYKAIEREWEQIKARIDNPSLVNCTNEDEE